MWKGKLVLKGVANEKDAEKAVQLGLDGLIVSNHGGR
jgi:L-lactate dehydrogenase (cytochrome)